ncbi:MAG: 4Fe-4S binding protein [Armatimonadota bacterium]
MILSKLKEAIICLGAGRVTLPYPFAPHPPAAGFRGRLSVDPEKCIGCGGCANVCTPRAIVVTDPEQERRVIEFFLERCTYCARCAEVCREKAITLTEQFETATNDVNDLHVKVEVFMGSCQRCGRCFEPTTPLDKMMATGFRGAPGDAAVATPSRHSRSSTEA